MELHTATSQHSHIQHSLCLKREHKNTHLKIGKCRTFVFLKHKLTVTRYLKATNTETKYLSPCSSEDDVKLNIAYKHIPCPSSHLSIMACRTTLLLQPLDEQDQAVLNTQTHKGCVLCALLTS